VCENSQNVVCIMLYHVYTVYKCRTLHRVCLSHSTTANTLRATGTKVYTHVARQLCSTAVTQHRTCLLIELTLVATATPVTACSASESARTLRAAIFRAATTQLFFAHYWRALSCCMLLAGSCHCRYCCCYCKQCYYCYVYCKW
jgi:hypothetical protein